MLRRALRQTGPAVALRRASRALSGDKKPGPLQRLVERTEKYREVSEAALEKSRDSLKEDMNDHRGKLLELRSLMKEEQVTAHAPPDALYAPRQSFVFPTMECESLAGEKAEMSELLGDGLTLMGLAGSNFSQAMVDGWLDGTVAALGATAEGDGSARPLKVVWLSLVDGGALWMLQRPLLFSMRLSVPRHRHAHFYTRFGDSMDVRSQLRMENRFLGYVCLVDRGTVRWHVHSNQAPGEEAVRALAALVAKAQGR